MNQVRADRFFKNQTVAIIGNQFTAPFEAVQAELDSKEVIAIQVRTNQVELKESQKEIIRGCDAVIIANERGDYDIGTREGIHYANRHKKEVVLYDETIPSGWSTSKKIKVGTRIYTPSEDDHFVLEEGSVIDSSEVFRIVTGAVLLYSSDGKKPSMSLAVNCIWPGADRVHEVFNLEAAGECRIVRETNLSTETLDALADLISWQISKSADIETRILHALWKTGPASNQRWLASIINAQRESICKKLNELQVQGFIKVDKHRYDLTKQGIARCQATFTLEAFMQDDFEDDMADVTQALERALEASHE